MAKRPHSVDALFWTAIVASILIIGVLLYRGSLWIDEGYTAWFAGHGSLASLYHSLENPLTNPADRQYPLYLLWIYGWCKVFGISEVSLRAANLPFVALYVVAIALTSRAVANNRFGWLPFAFAPFIWYYTSEARSYLMLAAIATVATCSALYFVYKPASRTWAIWLVCGSLCLTLACNVLGVLFLPGLATLFFLTRRELTGLTWSAWRAPSLFFTVFLVLACGYYASTVSGAGAHKELQTNHRAVPSLVYAAEGLYEQLGFDGLGPPRNSLRNASRQARMGYELWLIVGVILFGLSVVAELRAKPDARFRAAFSSWAVSFCSAIAISLATDGRFLGRHMAAFFPLLVLAAIFLLRSRVSIVVLTLVFLASDYRLTFVASYLKDDYESAVRDVIARNTAEPGSIDWAADGLTANYYGLRLSFPGHEDYERYVSIGYPVLADGTGVSNFDAREAESLVRAQRRSGKGVYLALSKADVYDKKLGWQAAIMSLGARPVAEYRAISIYHF